MALQIERILDSRFEFSLDGGDILSSDQNRLFTDGSYCHFKTGNGANIIKKQDILFSDVTIIDTYGGTGSYTPPNVQSLWIKLVELNFFKGLDGVGVTQGVTRFSALIDTPQYFGNNGKIPIVNESEQRLDYTTFYNFNLLTQLEDVAISQLVEGKIIGVTSVEGQLKFTLVDNGSGTGTPSNSQSIKIPIIATQGQTQILVDSKPSSLLLYKNGIYQIERDGYDFTYNQATGIISLLYVANENDYYEVVFIGGSTKILIVATADNQDTFSFSGNPAFVDVYLNGSRLREGVGYTRSSFSSNNDITIINQDLIDDIRIGHIVEVITY